MAAPMRIVGKWRLAVSATELPDKFGFGLDRDAPRSLLPCNKQSVGKGQLPDEASAPMPDRFAHTKIGILREATAQIVRLADINDFRILDPVGGQGIVGNRRVLAFEPAPATFLQKGYWPVCAKGDDIHAACPWAGTAAYCCEGHPADEAGSLKIKPSELHIVR